MLDIVSQNGLLAPRRGMYLLLVLLVTMLLVTACQGEDEEPPPPAATLEPTRTPTPVGAQEQEVESTGEINFITVATDAPSRFKKFEDINPFGDVIGFDPELMAFISERAGIDYEFVVTGFDGLLASVTGGEFDAAMSAIIIPEQPEEGLVYTIPYLEVGQVLVVRANETALLDYTDIETGVPIGVQRFTNGEQIVRGIGLSEPDLQLYDSPAAALQALIDGLVEGVVIDNIDAEHFTTNYPQQLKITGGAGREAWISEKAYGIAVAASNNALLTLLNETISQALAEGIVDRLIDSWLVGGEDINAGESLVGTPIDEVVIGVSGQFTNLDPAASPADFIGWEIKSNIMSGLFGLDENSQIIPILASGSPEISEDNLEYTLTLRPGLQFPSGSEVTAEDVKYSVDRAARLGNYLVNSYLKDDNDDGFADSDAVRVVDTYTVRFLLQEPTSYFPSVLATPPYFVLDSVCFGTNPDPVNGCQGFGKYRVVQWEPGVQIRLEANPQWPGAAPNFSKIQVRFYEDPDRMRRSLENSAIDMAWSGTTPAAIRDFRNRRGFTVWDGPPVFKSYLVFEQDTDPWDDPRVREAIAMAIDRERLVESVFAGLRTPLYSPVPDGTPGHQASEPARDLGQATFILNAAGYTASSKLVIDLWYEDGGRYSLVEGQYAQALKEQLEETGVIEVNISGAPYSVFRSQSATCNYPTYLLGWPSPGQPVGYVDAMSWIEYFITNTDTLCSNYESERMQALYEAALVENDTLARQVIYGEMQQLWAQEFPTLDLTQESQAAITLPNVSNVVIDALGLLHYDKLLKSSG